MIGLVIFAVASLLGGIAANEAMLLAARGLQGLGAALASPAALALITTTFPAGPARNRAFAVYAAMSGAGAAVGLILGGWLTGSSLDLFGIDVDGWRMTFLINVPIGIVAALLAPRVFAESESHPGELDVPGALTGTFGLLGLVYGLSRAAQEGWTDTWTLASLVVGVALLALFVLDREPRRAPAAAVPDLPEPHPGRELRGDDADARRDVLDVLLPEPVHPERHGLQPAARPASRSCRSRVGIVVAAGHLLQPDQPDRPALPRRRRHADGRRRAVRVLPAALRHDVPDEPTCTGQLRDRHLAVHRADVLGMGMTFVPLTLTAVHHVRAEDSGIGSGVLNTMQQVGGALGLADPGHGGHARRRRTG